MQLPFPIGAARPTQAAWHEVLVQPWRRLACPWWRAAAVCVLCMLGLWALQSWDAVWLRLVVLPPDALAYGLAQRLSEFGEFQWFNLGLTLVCFVPGWLFRKIRWRTLGWAVLYASLMAGLAVNLVRPVTGRPRPSTGVADALYGPSKGLPLGFDAGYAYQAFPSGHTSTAVAAATVCLRLCPAVGVPVAVVAVGISWSRMALNRHHPTDVLGGVALGLACGLAVAGPLRRTKALLDPVRTPLGAPKCSLPS